MPCKDITHPPRSSTLIESETSLWLCSHQEEYMGLEPRDRSRISPTYYYSQWSTWVFYRFLSPQLWALQDEMPLLPKGAGCHQGTQRGSHWSSGLKLPPEHFGILQQARSHHLVRRNWPWTARGGRLPDTQEKQGGTYELRWPSGNTFWHSLPTGMGISNKPGQRRLFHRESDSSERTKISIGGSWGRRGFRMERGGGAWWVPGVALSQLQRCGLYFVTLTSLYPSFPSGSEAHQSHEELFPCIMEN